MASRVTIADTAAEVIEPVAGSQGQRTTQGDARSLTPLGSSRPPLPPTGPKSPAASSTVATQGQPIVFPAMSCTRCHARLEIDTSFLRLEGEELLGEKVDPESMGDSFIFLPRPDDNPIPAGDETPETDPKQKRKTRSYLNRRRFRSGSPTSEEGMSSAGGSSVEFEAVVPTDQEALASARIFAAVCNTASEKLELDYPLCEECAFMAEQHLKKRMESAEAERDTYLAHLKELEGSKSEVIPEEEFEKEMAKARGEEEGLRKELAAAEKEGEVLQSDLLVLAEEEKELRDIEERYWRDLNDYQSQLHDCMEQRDAVVGRIDRLNSQIEKLRRTNVYNDAFHIWHDGHFGTINNLRLGRLPSVKVPWEEINAAWGQAVLLLYSMAKKSGFMFSSYRLIPMGSYSKMARISDDKNYFELYKEAEGIAKYTTGLFWSRRFDTAMTWFLQCVKEFGEFAHEKDASFALPYGIKSDTIGSLSIKLQINREEEWTKALKYMLTNLKWLLSWMARQSGHSQAKQSGHSQSK